MVRRPIRTGTTCFLESLTTLALLSGYSEHLVQEAIDDMLARGKNVEGGNLTVLIVAHRLSTVRNADKIFVVQGGKVVEEGRHDDLLEQDGAYAQLIKRQMEAHSKLENGKQQF